MIYNIPTRHEEFTLAVTVTTSAPQVIRIILQDTDVANLQFTNRYKTVNGDFTFLIRCPVSGWAARLIIYNEATGNIPSKSDATFRVLDIKKMPLEKRLDVIDFNPLLKSFLKFEKDFCYFAGELKPIPYQSQDGRFVIQYLATIIDDRTGQVVNTSARISKETGVMQVSQQKFIPMTFPMRIAILLHEFAHFNMNQHIDDEFEADLNALLIYLGLGYPRIEAHEAWLGAFMGAPTEQNKVRYDILKSFIDDFDSNSTRVNV